MEPHGQGPSSTLRHAQPRQRPIEAVGHRDEREAEGDEPRGEARRSRDAREDQDHPCHAAQRWRAPPRASRRVPGCCGRAPQPVDGQEPREDDNHRWC